MANALRAGFHGIAHRFLPTSVGSNDVVTKVQTLHGGLFGRGTSSDADGSPVSSCPRLDRVRVCNVCVFERARVDRDEQRVSHAVARTKEWWLLPESS
jgi:hypothetical protein